MLGIFGLFGAILWSVGELMYLRFKRLRSQQEGDVYISGVYQPCPRISWRVFIVGNKKHVSSLVRNRTINRH